MTAQLILSAFLATISIFVAWAHTFAQNREHGRYVGRLHDEHNRERELWHRERAELLNRIKPETAQYVPTNEPVTAPPYLGFDEDEPDDVGNMSTADLAQAMMAQELAGHSQWRFWTP